MKTVTGATDGSAADETPERSDTLELLVPAQTGAAVDAPDDEPPIWAPAATAAWPTPPTRMGRRRTGDEAAAARPARRPGPRRRPALGFAALIVLGLVATFLSWVSAEPLWLAVGHGERGTATATHCSAEGVPYECVTFTTADGRYTVRDVALLGTDQGRLPQGTSVSAQMVSPHSGRAYAVDPAGLNMRWAIGLALVLLCGLGIARATGTAGLDDPGSRRRAFLACLGAPLLLTLGFLAATW